MFCEAATNVRSLPHNRSPMGQVSMVDLDRARTLSVNPVLRRHIVDASENIRQIH